MAEGGPPAQPHLPVGQLGPMTSSTATSDPRNSTTYVAGLACCKNHRSASRRQSKPTHVGPMLTKFGRRLPRPTPGLSGQVREYSGRHRPHIRSILGQIWPRSVGLGPNLAELRPKSAKHRLLISGTISAPTTLTWPSLQNSAKVGRGWPGLCRTPSNSGLVQLEVAQFSL